MKSLFVALATVLAIDGATGSPSRVEFINIGLCDKMFTEDIAFDSPNGNHLQCARQCSMQDSCLTFTIAENMCRGHSVLVTSQTPSMPTPGANSFAKRSTYSRNYMEALNRSIVFHYAQRSGNLTGTFRPLPWVVSSAMDDNPVGGWYRGGDYLKYTIAMAWSVVTQLWSVVRFRAGYQAAGQFDVITDSARWALDYLLRCWDNESQELVVMVGDWLADHAVWTRPQDMVTDRPVYKANTTHNSSDVAGLTAAALALGYIVFNESDAEFANSMLTAAEQIYTFGTTYKGIQETFQHTEFTNREKSKELPNTGVSTYNDELCVAAVWLKRATEDNSYFRTAKNTFYSSDKAWVYSTDANEVACQLLHWEETRTSKYKKNVEKFFRDWLRGSDPDHTPCGLVYRSAVMPIRYAVNAAFLALVASRDGIESVDGKNLNQFAVEQVNYMLGDNAQRSGSNCYSFLIGYGNNFPRQPHHRAASCPVDISQACITNDTLPNPSELTGGLVGGPADVTDQYEDRRSYMRHRVSCDLNAAMQAALAGIVFLKEEDNMPMTNNKCKCP